MSLRGVNIDFNGHNKSNVMTYNEEYIYENKFVNNFLMQN